MSDEYTPARFKIEFSTEKLGYEDAAIGTVLRELARVIESGEFADHELMDGTFGMPITWEGDQIGTIGAEFIDDEPAAQSLDLTSAALLNQLDDVSAALETVMLHYGDKMPDEDRTCRNRLVAKARGICNALLRAKEDA